MPKPTVTVNVKRLEAAGFVRREIDATDLRRHRLIVTPAGRKAMTRGLALLSEAFGARLARLTAAQQAELKSAAREAELTSELPPAGAPAVPPPPVARLRSVLASAT